MNFGFDIDGTISATPRAYCAVMSALYDAGHGVHVITGGLHPHPPTPDQIGTRHRQLEGFGLTEGSGFTKLHIVNGVTTEQVAQGKRDICDRERIRLMFEDSMLYAEAISDVTQCLMMVPR